MWVCWRDRGYSYDGCAGMWMYGCAGMRLRVSGCVCMRFHGCLGMLVRDWLARCVAILVLWLWE